METERLRQLRRLRFTHRLVVVPLNMSLGPDVLTAIMKKGEERVARAVSG